MARTASSHITSRRRSSRSIRTPVNGSISIAAASAKLQTCPAPFSSEWLAEYTKPQPPYSCRCPAWRSCWRQRQTAAQASAEWRAYFNLNDREECANPKITRACEKVAREAEFVSLPKRHRRRAKSFRARSGACSEGMAAPCNKEWDKSAESRRRETPRPCACGSSAKARQTQILLEAEMPRGEQSSDRIPR